MITLRNNFHHRETTIKAGPISKRRARAIKARLCPAPKFCVCSGALGLRGDMYMPSVKGGTIVQQTNNTFLAIQGKKMQFSNDDKEAPSLLDACKALAEFWGHGTPVHAGSDVANDVLLAIAREEAK